MRKPVAEGRPVVVKVGSSSITAPSGGLDEEAVRRVVRQIVDLANSGHPPVLVTSGAIAAGLPTLGLSERPTDVAGLQVAAAIGQTKLVQSYAGHFADSGLSVAQVLLTKDVLGNRSQYLNARAALERMLSLGVIPVVNENDTVVVDELKLGDNDRLAALTAHLVGAGMLVILTDTEGLFSEDPSTMPDAKLLSAVEHSDSVLDRIERTTATGTFGSGGVTTKIAAARMAAFSGIPTVIVDAGTPDLVAEAVAGNTVGTWIGPRRQPLPARKLWIAFGVAARGEITIDAGAVGAIRGGGGSLLAVGVSKVEGDFVAGDAVEVFGAGHMLVAKGITRLSADVLREAAGSYSDVIGGEVIHRDDLVVL